MPDAQTVYPSDYLSRFLNKWTATGKFIPSDIIVFIGSPYFWQELKFVIPLFLSGLALALFLRSRGLSELASFSGAILLAFCGYWSTLFSAGHLGWFQWMSYGVFAFYLIEKALETKKLKSYLFLGALVAWGCFYQPDLWLLFTVFTAIYFLYRSIQTRVFELRGVLLALVAFLLIALPAIRSALFTDLAGRDAQIENGETLTSGVSESEKRWVFVTNWSLPPSETLEFLIPRVNGDTSCPFTLHFSRRAGHDVKPYTGALGRPYLAERGNYRQHSLYVGFVTILFAILGLVFSWRKCLFFACAALVAYLFSLGRYCEGVYRLVYALPFGDYLRAPVKWHHLTEFCLVILAAYGIDWALSFKAKLKALPMIVGLIVLIGAVDLARVDKLYCAPMKNIEARRIGFYRPEEYSKSDTLSIVLGSISILASLTVVGALKYEK